MSIDQTYSRRNFLKYTGLAGSVMSAVGVLPRPLLAYFGPKAEVVPPIADPRVKTLALRAIDAASRQGATYADVRLTHDRVRHFGQAYFGPAEEETMAIGVRVLVNGYWGFASSATWSPEEADRLAQEAIHIARASVAGQTRPVELADTSQVQDGEWHMPIELNPFDVPIDEVQDFLSSMAGYAQTLGDVVQPSANATFWTQEKAFASTLGSYCTQRLFRTSGLFQCGISNDDGGMKVKLDLLSPAGMGWELFRRQPVHEAIFRMVNDAKEDLKLPLKPIDVGRYDTVIDASSVGSLVSGTLGLATELDRILGFEANAGGTSYITSLDEIGALRMGSDLLNITADRSMPGGAATVAWDDDGVAPEAFPLIRSGILIDAQTDRETAVTLRPTYMKQATPLRSRACAYAPSGIDAPQTHSANLSMSPGAVEKTFDDLVTDVSNGIAFKELSALMDYQQSSGLGVGQCFEVKRGKRTARLFGAGVLFRSQELWKKLSVVGGKSSVRTYGHSNEKGEPPRESFHSVRVPPAAFTELTIVDYRRKS